ncbi:tetratricopeptide repeat protein [Alteromonadaceae bacterium BrNp21-10]|nr:tetratricopeptide repeat protein [Alteromonadaceae bacterium BrNp21-10]
MEQFSTEEQQVEAIKQFWKENGVAIVIGAVIGLGGLWGWRYYNEQAIQAKEATSKGYEQVITALDASDDGFSKVSQFIEANNDSSYSLFAALQLAKKAVDVKDYAEAAKQLTWANNHATDTNLKNIVGLRLARIQIQQQQYDEALATLDGINDESFAANVAEVKGDVYSRQGKIDQARAAYSLAIEKNAGSPLLQVKLDNLAAVSA